MAAYAARYGNPKTYAAYGAAAAQVLIDAIGRSDGTRADIALPGPRRRPGEFVEASP
jgi:xanthine dehydrogenase molybdopterin-binding subunit B